MMAFTVGEQYHKPRIDSSVGSILFVAHSYELARMAT